jgi:hypothetical protein
MRMITTVNERCRYIATFRHISVWLMETVARWTPLTPEMEVKVVFGRHIWEYAQMADALGKRTFELRQPEHYTIPPVDAYEALLKDIAKTESTADRVAVIYDGLLPGLIERYRNYLAATDPILDEPTLVIMERIVRELERQRVDVAALQSELKLGNAAAAAVAAREKAVTTLITEERVAA